MTWEWSVLIVLHNSLQLKLISYVETILAKSGTFNVIKEGKWLFMRDLSLSWWAMRSFILCVPNIFPTPVVGSLAN